MHWKSVWPVKISELVDFLSLKIESGWSEFLCGISDFGVKRILHQNFNKFN